MAYPPTSLPHSALWTRYSGQKILLIRGTMHSLFLSLSSRFWFPSSLQIIQTRQSHPPVGTPLSCYYKTCLPLSQLFTASEGNSRLPCMACSVFLLRSEFTELINSWLSYLSSVLCEPLPKTCGGLSLINSLNRKWSKYKQAPTSGESHQNAGGRGSTQWYLSGFSYYRSPDGSGGVVEWRMRSLEVQRARQRYQVPPLAVSLLRKAHGPFMHLLCSNVYSQHCIRRFSPYNPT